MESLQLMLNWPYQCSMTAQVAKNLKKNEKKNHKTNFFRKKWHIFEFTWAVKVAHAFRNQI
jgi:hypothetical protein